LSRSRSGGQVEDQVESITTKDLGDLTCVKGRVKLIMTED